MNKKRELIHLITASIIIPDDFKIGLLDIVETMTSEQVERLGTFLSTEHQYVTSHAPQIMQRVHNLIE